MLEREACRDLSDPERADLRDLYDYYAELSTLDRPFVGLFAVKQLFRVGLETVLTKEELADMKGLFEKHSTRWWKRSRGGRTLLDDVWWIVE